MTCIRPATNTSLQGKGATKTDKSKPSPALTVDSEEEEHKLMARLERDYACQEHPGKSCYVKTGGPNHYHFTRQDLAIWVTLLVCLLFVIHIYT